MGDIDFEEEAAFVDEKILKVGRKGSDPRRYFNANFTPEYDTLFNDEGKLKILTSALLTQADWMRFVKKYMHGNGTGVAIPKEVLDSK